MATSLRREHCFSKVKFKFSLGAILERTLDALVVNHGIRLSRPLIYLEAIKLWVSSFFFSAKLSQSLFLGQWPVLQFQFDHLLSDKTSAMFPTLTPATTLMAFVLLYTSQVVEAVPALGAPLVPRQTTDCAKDPPATFVTQNAKDAQDMNVHFKLINKDEQCKDGETACIDKQLAHCESSKWILTPCAPELSCYALPLFDKSGTDIECKAPKSAASIFEQACMENGPYGDLVAREEECDDPNNSGNGNGNNDPNNPGNGNGNDDPNNPGNGNGNEDPNNGNGNDDSNDPNNPNNDNGNGDNYGIGDGPGNQPSNGPDGNQNDENSNGNPNNGDGSSSSTMPVPSYGPDSSDMPSSGPNCDTPTMTITMTITMNPSPTMSMNRGMPTPNMARRAGSGLVSIMPEVTPFTSSTQSSLSTGVISFSQ